MAKISIIIPIYNVEKYIKQALNSVVNQTLKDIEIICINDCTQDNSFEIVKEYAKNDNRFVLLEQQENQGQGVARNRGVFIASSKYIMFLDPDDWYEQNTCELAYNKIIKDNNDFVIFDFYNFYEAIQEKVLDNKFSNSFKHLENTNNISSKDCDFYFFFYAYSVNKIYKKSFLTENNIKFSNARFLEDLSFTIKIFANTQNFSFIPIPLYNYRQKETENVALDYTLHYKDIINAHTECYFYIKEKNNKNLTQNYIIYTINSTSYWFNRFTQINPNIGKDFYQRQRKYYLLLLKNEKLRTIPKETNAKIFKQFIKYKKYEAYKIRCIIKNIIQNIFSIKNINHLKFVIILGLKFQVKKNKGQ